MGSQKRRGLKRVGALPDSGCAAGPGLNRCKVRNPVMLNFKGNTGRRSRAILLPLCWPGLPFCWQSGTLNNFAERYRTEDENDVVE